MNYKVFKYYISESLLIIFYIFLLSLLKVFYIFGYGSFFFVSAVKVVSPVLYQSLFGKLYIFYNYFFQIKITNIFYKIPSIIYILLGQVEKKKLGFYAIISLILSIVFLQKTKAWLYAIPWMVNLFLMLICYLKKRKNCIFEAWCLIWIYSQVGTICYGYFSGFLDQAAYTVMVFPIFIEKIIWTILYCMSQKIFVNIEKFSTVISFTNVKFFLYKFFKEKENG